MEYDVYNMSKDTITDHFYLKRKLCGGFRKKNGSDHQRRI